VTVLARRDLHEILGMKLRYIAMRLVKTVLVAVAVVLLSFFLIRIVPGDAATVMAGQAGYADEQYMQSLRAEYGLDQPLPVQLWKYASAVAHGDLGTSYVRRQPVAQIIMERLPNTLLLNAFALLIAASGGIALGSLAARRPGSLGDSAVTVLAMLFYAVPQFWLGLMMVLVFAVWLAWLPPFGIETMGADYTGLARLADVAQHIILPAVTLALYFLASYARLTRTSMIEVADQDFVKTARAKGISERQVARRHILRNALIPLITYAGLQASILVGGSVLVENVFSWPGIGTLASEAVKARDNPLLLGIFIVTAILVCLFNLVTDIAYSIADPRVELS
jgi:peptide/nickel transport system permease protein